MWLWILWISRHRHTSFIRGELPLTCHLFNARKTVPQTTHDCEWYTYHLKKVMIGGWFIFIDPPWLHVLHRWLVFSSIHMFSSSCVHSQVFRTCFLNEVCGFAASKGQIPRWLLTNNYYIMSPSFSGMAPLESGCALHLNSEIWLCLGKRVYHSIPYCYFSRKTYDHPMVLGVQYFEARSYIQHMCDSNTVEYTNNHTDKNILLWLFAFYSWYGGGQEQGELENLDRCFSCVLQTSHILWSSMVLHAVECL